MCCSYNLSEEHARGVITICALDQAEAVREGRDPSRVLTYSRMCVTNCLQGVSKVRTEASMWSWIDLISLSAIRSRDESTRFDPQGPTRLMVVEECMKTAASAC